MIRFGALLLLLSLFSGCGEDPECKVTDNQDGTSTIRCPGSAPVTVHRKVPGETTCTLTVGQKPGQKVIRCTDGTVVEFDGEHVVFPGSGSLAGVAQRYGAEDHSGIRVHLLEGDHETHTASDGSYRLDSIPAGHWTVVFEAEPMSPQIVRNIPIIAGLFHMNPIELRAGRLVADDGTGLLSPSGDSALGIWTWDDTARVDLWRVDAPERIPLGHTIRTFGYDHEGSAVFTLALETFAGALRHWSVENGSHLVVATHVREARYAGRRLVYQHMPAGEDCHLEVWTPPGEEPARELGPCVPGDSWSVSPDRGAIAYHRPDGMRVVQELDTGETRELGPEGFWDDPWQFTVSGRFVFFRASWDELKVLDRTTGATRVLSTGEIIHQVISSPTDDVVAIITGSFPDTSLWLHDLPEETASLLLSGGPLGTWRFSKNGRRLAGPRGVDPPMIVAIDRLRPESVQTAPLPWARSFVWAPDGTDMVVQYAEGLYLWEMDTGAEPIQLSENDYALWSLSDDGELVAAEDRERVMVFDRRLRTLKELPLVGSQASALTWLPGDGGLLISRESIYGSDLRHWPLGSTRDPVALLHNKFQQVLPDSDGEGFLYIQCDSASCDMPVMGHYDLRAGLATPLDGRVVEISARRQGFLYRVEGDDRAGWYYARRP